MDPCPHCDGGGELVSSDWYDVDESSGCWIWNRAKISTGYGALRRKGRTMLAHRWVYERLVGPIPEGLTLDHVKARGCISTACVNPAHLEPVTQAENNRRSSRAKLTASDVEAIRASDVGPTALARQYGVSKRHICMIRANSVWVAA